MLFLINIFEANPYCLWDVYHTNYTNSGFKQIAYTDIATSLDTNILLIKTKINGLRAQLGRQMAKGKSTKSGPNTEKLYPIDTGRKLNVHKTFRRRPGRLLNVLCKFSLRPVSTGLATRYTMTSQLSWFQLLRLRKADTLQRE